jgi:hypothetical protein
MRRKDRLDFGAYEWIGASWSGQAEKRTPLNYRNTQVPQDSCVQLVIWFPFPKREQLELVNEPIFCQTCRRHT